MTERALPDVNRAERPLPALSTAGGAVRELLQTAAEYFGSASIAARGAGGCRDRTCVDSRDTYAVILSRIVGVALPVVSVFWTPFSTGIAGPLGWPVDLVAACVTGFLLYTAAEVLAKIDALHADLGEMLVSDDDMDLPAPGRNGT